MIPLIVQISVFSILVLLRRMKIKSSVLKKLYSRAETVCIGALFVTTGIAHFTMLDGMSAMLPDFVPFKLEIIYLTGFFEIIAGLLLILNSPVNKVVGYALLVFLVLSLPFNIYSAVKGVGLGAKGISYLYFRVPLQLFWAWWIYFFVIKEYKEISN